jgi:hypothetical protein
MDIERMGRRQNELAGGQGPPASERGVRERLLRGFILTFSSSPIWP